MSRLRTEDRQEHWMGLLHALADVRGHLETHAGRPLSTERSGRFLRRSEVSESLEPLDFMIRQFGLSLFESNVLVLCAGLELDSSFAELCAAAQGDPARSYPTMSLALAALPEPQWNALSPSRPLRRWSLLDIEKGQSLMTSPLKISERVLHFLLGEQYMDPRVDSLLEPIAVPREDELPLSHKEVVQRLADVWATFEPGTDWPVIHISGESRAAKHAIAAAACAMVGMNLWSLGAEAISSNVADLDVFTKLWERETVLAPSALLVECAAPGTMDPAREAIMARLLDRVSGVLLVTDCRRPSARRPSIHIEVGRPTFPEFKVIWQNAIGDSAACTAEFVDSLASQFRFRSTSAQAACGSAFGSASRRFTSLDERKRVESSIWNACRQQTRPKLRDLARRIEVSARFEDLILPPAILDMLREIVAGQRQRVRVYEDWGFAGRGERNLGLTALFSGPSGTGKTMAAEVIAAALGLDLFMVDLSQIVSKYIGETEKNLRQIFDAADEGGAVLLFDEADALFGKRSEVRDSHDRYANLEVGYLLQRLEAFQGVAVLTTNMKSALDTAFLRRIRFVLEFPFPSFQQRLEIWQRVFPAEVPLAGIDFAKVARLRASGGNIRNIALHAAFLAADDNGHVTMAQILRAARSEYAKSERTLTEGEIEGWI